MSTWHIEPRQNWQEGEQSGSVLLNDDPADIPVDPFDETAPRDIEGEE